MSVEPLSMLALDPNSQQRTNCGKDSNMVVPCSGLCHAMATREPV